MKNPQLITLAAAIILTAGIYLWGKTLPPKRSGSAKTPVAAKDEHGHDEISIDTILILAKKQLSAEQAVKVNTLENAISRGDIKEQKLQLYRQLARFWADSARIFEPYAWYTAEGARLENSEKSLNFAARLFLENLQGDELEKRRKWKALQAKDLFERSLKINPENDSVKVGLGACYLFGNISETPMEGILKIREVAERDSNNLYAQYMLAKGALISGQYDKAILRLEKVCRLQPDNVDAMLLLADVYERTGDKTGAVKWYRESLPKVTGPEARSAIEKRISELLK